MEERESTIAEQESPIKSTETNGSYVTHNIPFIFFSFSNTSIISSIVVSVSNSIDKSKRDTFGTGTLIASPSNLPSNSGITRPTFLADPVVDGIIIGFGLYSYRLALESLIKDE